MTTDERALQDTTIGRLKTRPKGWRRVAWSGGAFETAFRERTDIVEGSIRSDNHLIMVTLGGGADRHEITTSDGHRYDGPDRPGFVSFLPAGCERKLRLHNVCWRWAAIALVPDTDRDGQFASIQNIGPFTGVEDNFLFGMLSEFERLDAMDGGLDTLYCETMTGALKAYLGRRFTTAHPSTISKKATLPQWRLRKVSDYIDAYLASEIRIAELAELCGLSERHFHRAFHDTTGRTPLDFIQTRRIDAARSLLARGTFSVTEVAFQVGFGSPSHFARVFRSISGKSPAEYRRVYRVA